MKFKLRMEALLLGVMLDSTNGISWGNHVEASLKLSSTKSEVIAEDSAFDAHNILEGNSKKTATFSQAVSLLQTLEHSPSCYRTAARVLVNNCQRLQNSWHSRDNQINSPEHELMYHRYSYALSLAVCDLTVAQKQIDPSCTIFSESAIKQLPVHDHGKPLQVAKDHIEGCMSALTNDGVGWTSFNGNKEPAFTICQASREAMEKDEILETYRATGHVVETFSDLLTAQLQQWKRTQEAQQHANSRFFNDIWEQMTVAVTELVSSIHFTNKDLTESAKDIQMNLAKTNEKTDEVKHELDQLYESIRQKHFQHVLASRTAAAAHSDLAVGMQTTNEQAAIMQELVVAMGASLMAVQPIIETLALRMDNLEQMSSETFRIASNVSEQMYVHTGLSDIHQTQLQQQVLLMANLNDATRNMSKLAPNFAKDLALSVLRYAVLDVQWWILAVSTIGLPFIGTRGLEPSIACNLALAAIGFTIPVVLSAVGRLGVAFSSVVYTVWPMRPISSEHSDNTLITSSVTLPCHGIYPDTVDEHLEEWTVES